MSDQIGNLPPQLIKALLEDRCLFYLGAGVSLNAGIQDAKRLSNDLASELISDMSGDPAKKERIGEIESKKDDLKRISQLYNDFYKGNRAYKKVAENIAKQERTARKEILEPLRYIYPIREIITTNYDTLVEDVLDPSDCEVIYQGIDLRQANKRKLQLIKIHGTRTAINSMVLTEDDYHNFFKNHEALIDLTKTLLRTKVVVVVGYSLEDENFARIYKEAIGDDDSVMNFFVSPDASLYQELHWTKHGFDHIKLTAEDFFKKLKYEYENQTYKEETAKFSDRKAVITEPLYNPFVLYDTEALIEQKPQLLFETFVSPVGFPTILDHQHTFIEGHRGSGKSTILWRLSLQSFAYNKAHSNQHELPMWGFYIKMVPGLFMAFRRRSNLQGDWSETNEEWSKYFIHYFNLIILTGILKNLEAAIELKVLDANDGLVKTVNWIYRNLLRLENNENVVDLKSLRRLVETEIDTVVNDRAGLPFYTSSTFISRSLEALSDAIPDLNKKLWHVLLDEYDNVYPEQQAAINIILRERNQKIRYKIAVKTLHAYLKDIDGKTLDPTDDFGYISCDSVIWDAPLKLQYFKFLEDLSQQRLNYAGHTNINIRELLPNPDKSTEYYAGFESFCYLSSGLTRLYLELCKDAVYEAYPETAIRRVELKPIPARVQHHVVRLHSAILFKSYRSAKDPQKLLKMFRVFGPLFRGIAQVTSNQPEYRKPLSFEIEDLDQLSIDSLEVLDESVKSRLIQVPIFPKRPRDPVKDSPAQKYSFHRLLSPFFKLSLRERYPVPVKAKDFNLIWEDPSAVQKKLSRNYESKGIETFIDKILPLFDQEITEV